MNSGANSNRFSTMAAIVTLALAAPIAAASKLDDAALTTKVKAALVTDSKAHAMDVNVESRDGVVQLNGFVGSDAERKSAEHAAHGVKGVRKVENNLEVRKATRTAGVTADDAAIATRVKTALAADSQVSASEVVVEVHNGTVQLGGFVPNGAARKRAGDVAAKVDGVQKVDNSIDVRPHKDDASRM